MSVASWMLERALKQLRDPADPASRLSPRVLGIGRHRPRGFFRVLVERLLKKREGKEKEKRGERGGKREEKKERRKEERASVQPV